MPRRLRVSTGGLVYHVLNRAVARDRIFDDAEQEKGDIHLFQNQEKVDVTNGIHLVRPTSSPRLRAWRRVRLGRDILR